MSAIVVAAVINHAGPPWPVSSETRERIVAAAAKLQSGPNATARALAIGRMHALGVVVGGKFNDCFFEVLHGIITAASGHGQNTTVFTLNNWTNDSARLLPRSSVGERPTATRVVPARRQRAEDKGQSTIESRFQARVLIAVVALLITLAWRAQPVAIAAASTYTISITPHAA